MDDTPVAVPTCRLLYATAAAGTEAPLQPLGAVNVAGTAAQTLSAPRRAPLGAVGKAAAGAQPRSKARSVALHPTKPWAASVSEVCVCVFVFVLDLHTL